MKQAIIFHGRPSKEEFYDPTFPSPSNSHWLPWLQNQLLMNDIQAHTPEVVEPYSPKYANWLTELERYQTDEDTILIGHSRGGAFLLKYVNDNPGIRVGKVILVAPSYVQPPGDKSDFYGYKVDPSIVARTKGIVVFASKDDKDFSVESAKLLEQEVNDIEVRWYEDKGHFTRQSLGTDEFPELLKEVLR